MNKKRLFCVWAITLAMLVGSIGSSDAGTIAPPGERLSQGDEAMVSSGKPIGSPFLIVDEVAGVHAAFPAAAYNSQRQEYLVVWGNIRTGCSDIAAQRISTSGTLLGSRIWVAHGCPEDRYNPDVAYNSQDDEYLVVWNEDETDVRGQLLSGDGVLNGSAFDIALSLNDGTTSYRGSDPVVAYNATENLYLVVYESHLATGHGIFAQLLNNNGSAYGGSIEIEALSSSHAFEPDVAYNSLRNEFIVVWTQSHPSYGDIRGRFVKATGGWYGASGSAFWFDCDAGTDDRLPAIASVPLPPNGQYLVVWRNDGMLSGRYIFGQRIAGDGTPEVTGFFLLSATGINTFPAVAGSQQQYLVTYKSEQLPPDPPSEPIVVVPVGPSTMDHYGQGVGGLHTLSSAVVSGPGGDMLIAFDEYASGEADIFGVLWGNRSYMPLVVK